MHNYKWKIIKTKIGYLLDFFRYSHSVAHLNTDNDIDRLSNLGIVFSSSTDFDYPEMIENAINYMEFGFEECGVGFPESNDDRIGWGCEPIKSGMVGTSAGAFDDVQIPKTVFFQILLEMAEATLEGRKKLSKKAKSLFPGKAKKIEPVPDEWYQEMEEAITKLKKHIEDNKEKWEAELKESEE